MARGADARLGRPIAGEEGVGGTIRQSGRGGARQVYAVSGLNGVAGQRWSTEWRRNNLRIPGLAASGSIRAGQQEARLVRRLSHANNGPHPAGTYKIAVSLSDRRAFEAELRVLP